MGCLKQKVLEYLPDAQVGDQDARLRLLSLGVDADQEPVPEIVAEAAAYRLRGWSVVPQMSGAKKPCVLWKQFQERLPSVDEIEAWWRRRPDAGIAVALGPVSNLFVVDVDGEDAHHVLLKRLGSVPKTARSISGSGKPHRYHLFFSHPDVDTSAKFCPWHENLEFRGQGGIVVLPPSKHKSGGHYRWADGASVSEIAPAQVPASIVRELRARDQRRAKRNVPAASQRTAPATSPPRSGFVGGDRQLIVSLRRHLARRTMLFLAGKYADGPDWNCRLFKAACDLAGNSVPKETATRLLLAGAKPWNSEEVENALRTIESAYSQDRAPAKRKSWPASRDRHGKGRR